MTAPLIALAIPLLDTALAIAGRFLPLQPIFGADRGHIHHRLLARRFTPRRVAYVIYAGAGAVAGLALLLNTSYAGSASAGSRSPRRSRTRCFISSVSASRNSSTPAQNVVQTPPPPKLILKGLGSSQTIPWRTWGKGTPSSADVINWALGEIRG